MDSRVAQAHVEKSKCRRPVGPRIVASIRHIAECEPYNLFSTITRFTSIVSSDATGDLYID